MGTRAACAKIPGHEQQHIPSTINTFRTAAKGYKRIATEEAFAPPEMFEQYRKLLERNAIDDPGFQSLWGFYLRSPSRSCDADHRANPGPRRAAPAGHGCDRHRPANPLAHLAWSPGVRRGNGDFARPFIQRSAGRGDPRASGSLFGTDRCRAAGPAGGSQGNRARRDAARAQRRDHQFAYTG